MAEPFDEIDMERLVSAAVSRDERLQIIEQWFDIEAELQGTRAWRYVMACAEELRKEALEGLAKVAPHDQNRIRQLQAQAAVKANIEGFRDKMRDMADRANREIQIEEGHEAGDA